MLKTYCGWVHQSMSSHSIFWLSSRSLPMIVFACAARYSVFSPFGAVWTSLWYAGGFLAFSAGVGAEYTSGEASLRECHRLRMGEHYSPPRGA